MSKTKKKVFLFKKKVVPAGSDIKPGQGSYTEYADLDTALKAMHDEALVDMVHIANKYATHTSEFTTNTCKISTPCYTHYYTVEETEEDYDFKEEVDSALKALDQILTYVGASHYHKVVNKAHYIEDLLRTLLKEVTTQ